MDKVMEPVDVVIVGAGAAGSVYAAILAEAGKSVLVLERGPARRMEDLYSSQIWARRLKWASPEVVQGGADSIWFNFNAGRGYGGASIHHYAVWPRMHPEDFREQTLFGRSQDWPFEYDELRPYYDKVQKDVGMSGDAKKEIWRPPGDPYPLPPVLVTNHGKVLARGFEALGMHTAPIPMAVLFRNLITGGPRASGTVGVMPAVRSAPWLIRWRSISRGPCKRVRACRLTPPFPAY